MASILVYGALYHAVREWHLEWETYGNGPLPQLSEAFSAECFSRAWGMWYFLLAAVVSAALALRFPLRLAGTVWFTLLCGIPIVALAAKNQQLLYRTISCANHSGQWHIEFSHLLEERMETKGLHSITNTVEFDDLLGTLDWLQETARSGPGERSNLYCPGRKSSGSITGYAFVGGGLSLNEAKNEDALLIFCEAECRPPPYDRQLAIKAASGRHRVLLAEMIAMLEEALNQADQGRVGYSNSAIEIMRSELEKRRRMLNE